MVDGDPLICTRTPALAYLGSLNANGSDEAGVDVPHEPVAVFQPVALDDVLSQICIPLTASFSLHRSLEPSTSPVTSLMKVTRTRLGSGTGTPMGSVPVSWSSRRMFTRA